MWDATSFGRSEIRDRCPGGLDPACRSACRRRPAAGRILCRFAQVPERASPGRAGLSRPTRQAGHHVVHVPRAGRRPRPARPRCARPARAGCRCAARGWCACRRWRRPRCRRRAGRRRRRSAAGSSTPTASIAARNASRRRLGPRDLAGVDGAVERSSTPSRREELLVPLPRPDGVGQHPDLMPVDPQPAEQRHARRGRCRCAAPRTRGRPSSSAASWVEPGLGEDVARPSRWCGGRASGPRPRRRPARSARVRVGPSSASTAAAASARASCVEVDVCQGVSVPPQSKMTASTSGAAQSSAIGCRRARATARRRGRRRRPAATSSRSPVRPVLDLDDAVGQALADHDDRRARRSARRP